MDARERGDPDLSLTCPADADNVAVVRRAVTGLARAVGMDEGLVNDVRTVVTEACGNAAVHAYPAGAPGAMVVNCRYEHPWLSFRIRDFGSGMQPELDGDGAPRLRIGLSLMSALADRFEIQSNSGGGTEVMVGFDTLRGRDAEGEADDNGAAGRPADARSEPEGVELAAAGPLGAEGIAPALVMLGVRAGYDVERLADLQRMGAGLAATLQHGQVSRLELLSSPPGGPDGLEVELRAADAREAAYLAEAIPGASAAVAGDGAAVIRIELTGGG